MAHGFLPLDLFAIEGEKSNKEKQTNNQSAKLAFCTGKFIKFAEGFGKWERLQLPLDLGNFSLLSVFCFQDIYFGSGKMTRVNLRKIL